MTHNYPTLAPTNPTTTKPVRVKDLAALRIKTVLSHPDAYSNFNTYEKIGEKLFAPFNASSSGGQHTTKTYTIDTLGISYDTIPLIKHVGTGGVFLAYRCNVAADKPFHEYVAFFSDALDIDPIDFTEVNLGKRIKVLTSSTDLKAFIQTRKSLDTATRKKLIAEIDALSSSGTSPAKSPATPTTVCTPPPDHKRIKELLRAIMKDTAVGRAFKAEAQISDKVEYVKKFIKSNNMKQTYSDDTILNFVNMFVLVMYILDNIKNTAIDSNEVKKDLRKIGCEDEIAELGVSLYESIIHKTKKIDRIHDFFMDCLDPNTKALESDTKCKELRTLTTNKGYSDKFVELFFTIDKAFTN